MKKILNMISGTAKSVLGGERLKNYQGASAPILKCAFFTPKFCVLGVDRGAFGLAVFHLVHSLSTWSTSIFKCLRAFAGGFKNYQGA